MGEDHDRRVVARVAAPAVRHVVEPPAHDVAAGASDRLAEQRQARLVHVERRPAVRDPELGRPVLVEPEQVVAAALRVGDEAVDRHGQVGSHLRHPCLQCGLWLITTGDWADGGVSSPSRKVPDMSQSTRWTLVVVLLAPAVVCRCSSPCTTEDPELFGFPFYYWFQLALIPAAVLLTVDRLLPRQGAATRDRRAKPMSDVSTVAFSVFLFFFLLVTILGFAAARWRRAKALDNLDEWGLGGRGFGTFIAWFLIGGDLYTAYTFVAVPALLYAGSAIGFFAVPYTIVVYPLIFLFLPRLWSVRTGTATSRRPTSWQGRYDSRPLALAVALTGILATMPYIALQLVGIEVVLEVMGIGTEDSNWFVKRPAAVPRLRCAGGLHLLLGPPGAGADRLREGHADLHRDHRGGALPAHAARRLGRHLQRGHRLVRGSTTRPTPTPSPPARSRRRARSRRSCCTGPTRRWPSARRWRSSCTRTR